MYLISAQGYKNAGVDSLKIKETDEIWVSMKNFGAGLGVKNISDLVLKELYGIYETKELAKEETKCYKMTERKIYEKFDNLSKGELNTKSNKGVCAKNIIMTNISKHCRGEKKIGPIAIDGFRKKLKIPDYRISESIEHEKKSKIETIFVNENILRECSVKIYEINPCFYKHYNKKIQVGNNDLEYILFRIDVILLNIL